jgi:hypothetical protein
VGTTHLAVESLQRDVLKRSLPHVRRHFGEQRLELQRRRQRCHVLVRALFRRRHQRDACVVRQIHLPLALAHVQRRLQVLLVQHLRAIPPP